MLLKQPSVKSGKMRMTTFMGKTQRESGRDKSQKHQTKYSGLKGGNQMLAYRMETRPKA